MPIPRFDISRHMVVLVASPRNIDNALRVLHPPSRCSAAISIFIVAVPNFLLSDHRQIRHRHLRIMLKTPITRINRKVRRPFSRSIINNAASRFNTLSLFNFYRRSTESSAPANPRWRRVGRSYASHETSEYPFFQICDASWNIHL